MKSRLKRTPNAEEKLPLRKQVLSLLLLLTFAGSIPVHANELEQQLRQHINREIDHFTRQLGVKDSKRNIELFLPRGIEKMSQCDKLQISRRQQAEPPWGRISYSLSCSTPASWQSRATARISVWLDLVIAQRTLEREEVLAEDMLAIKTLEVSQINHGLEFQTAPLIGMKVRRRIAAGQPVARHLLQNAYLVTNGNHVTIRVQQQDFQATARGVALADGQLGERIKVQNLTSGKIIEGTVVGENLIETDSKRN
ncbi:flagellar basal body P-ring formation chaperone FlgA [Chromatiaceae bacterium AAb-1]|nr:flagellar basal body P-ring formation chaperone FlgA [Chromatiaceae bacterium AAb-1]